MIPHIYEMALKQNPQNEELYSHLFMSYVRIGDYKKQQQVIPLWRTSWYSCLLKNWVPYLPVYKSIPCISRPPIFDGKKRKFLNFFVKCSWDTNLVFFDFWKCGYTKKSGPQGLNSLVVQQLLYLRTFCPWVSKKFSENRTYKPETHLFRCSRIKGFRG